MIVTKLIGGLGNQMFQYAAGRALALRHKTGLMLDVSFLSKPAHGIIKRQFELDAFKIEIVPANDQLMNELRDQKNKVIKRVIGRNVPFLYKQLYAAESGVGFYRQFANYPANTYLDGFWQNEKYFKEFELQIRNEFQPKNALPAELNTILTAISGTESISVHVRRGDYVNDKQTQAFHGNCGLDYYQRAANYIASKLGSPVYYVFSDDINWCKNNMQLNGQTVFMEHKCGAYWDMYLMSKCKHHIIANSSFSWWGAWLNANPDKFVIAPEFWFSSTKSSTLGILPKKWITI